MYITTAELAEKLRVSKVTISKFIKEGMPVLKVGGVNRFEFEKVLEWFNGRER